MSECFTANSGVRQCCIMSPWLFNVYYYLGSISHHAVLQVLYAFQCIYGHSDEEGENGDGEDGSE